MGHLRSFRKNGNKKSQEIIHWEKRGKIKSKFMCKYIKAVKGLHFMEQSYGINYVPLEIKEIKTPDAFKTAIKKYIWDHIPSYWNHWNAKKTEEEIESADPA